MKLSDWADRQGIHYMTAWRWWKAGKLPVPAHQTDSGSILVDVASEAPGRTAVYARVSSHDQRADLDRQVSRMVAWATSQGLSVDEVVTEVGSGTNGHRRRLERLLADPMTSTLVVEHRDRLARFGVEHLEAALAAHGRRVLVVDAGEVDDDLVRDVTEVLTSFCARLYGRRGARNRADKALRCAKSDIGPMGLGGDRQVAP
jgi:putative resolvase